MKSPSRFVLSIVLSCLGAVAAYAQVITNISPSSVAPGSVVTVTGSGFTGATGTPLRFNGSSDGTGGQAVAVTVVNDGTVTAVVPLGAVSGQVSLTVGAVTALSSATLAIAPDWQLRNPSLTADVFRGVVKGDDGLSNPVYLAVGAAGDIIKSSDRINWSLAYTSRNQASANSFFAVTFSSSPHLFVAVGNNGVILTSPDGSAWTQRAAGSANYRGVAFGGGTFVAISTSTTVATSANGTTWATNTNGVASTNAVAYNAGNFVAVGNTGVIRTSPDGSTWTPRTSGTSNNLNGVSWCNDRFIAVGASSTVTSSPDGVTWTVQAVPNSTTALNAVSYGNGEYVAVSTATTFTSPNGTSWTVTANNNFEGRAVIFDGSQFVAAGFAGAIATAPDGVSWTLRNSATRFNYTDVVYGAGHYMAISSSNNSTYATSVDGVTWTAAPVSPGGNLAFNDIAYGFGNFVIVGTNVIYAVSAFDLDNPPPPDENLWDNVSPASLIFQAVAFGNGYFVAVGNGGIAYSSEQNDYGNWSAIAAVPGLVASNNLLGISYGSTGSFTGFVAVGAAGKIVTSPDGVTWTARISGTANQLNGVTFSGNKIVAVGASSTVLTSPDGVTWTPQTLGTAGINLNDVAYGDGLYAATNLTNVSQLFVSTDGVTWAPSNLTTHTLNQSTVAGIGFGNGRFAVVSSSGQILTTNPTSNTLAIVTQPASQTFTSGNTVTLNVTATGVGLHYQWYRESVQDHLFNTTLPVGTDSSSYTTVALTQSAAYWVRITDAAGNVVESKTVVLYGPPLITDNPENETLSAGSSIEFEIFALGSGTFTYQWKKDGVDIPGATSSHYVIPDVQAGDQGSYTAVATSSTGGTATSTAGVLTVTPQAPQIAGGMLASIRLVAVGQSGPLLNGYAISSGISLPAITGTKPFTYQWQKNGVNLSNGGSISGANTAILSLLNAQVGDSGNYSLIVTNSVNSSSSSSMSVRVVPEEPYTFTTLAGLSTRAAIDSAVPLNARFAAPSGTALDGDGVTIYLTDQGNHVIRKFNTSTGVVSTLAGLAGIPGGDDGTGTAARFNAPGGLAVDNAHNVYVLDTGNAMIRKVTPAGVVTTLAGSKQLYGLVDGTGSAARFNQFFGLASDGTTYLYLADFTNDSIRRINTTTAEVTTIAGVSGLQGTIDGTGIAARFVRPNGIVRDSANGDLYVTDSSAHVLRKVTAAGVVTTLAGSAGSAGSADGLAGAARFNGPRQPALDSAKNIYVADASNHTIRKITPSGQVTTFAGVAGSAGSADGTGSSARFSAPTGIVIDGSDNLYVTDLNNNTVRKITSAGVVTTIAGLAPRASGYDGTGAGAQFSAPTDVAVDASGNVYVADTSYHIIRKIDPNGVTTTIAGLAGTSGSTNATGGAARFNGPTGVAVDAANNVYVADAGNNLIRKIDAGGVVTTFAGSGAAGAADATGTAASFRGPRSVTVDSSGNVYVADQTNHTIRKITSGGVVTTLAGLAQSSGFVDNTGTAARFNNPWKVAVDSSGNVWVADRSNGRVRKVTSGGVVSTVMTTPGIVLGVAADASGNVYFATAASIFKYYPLTDDVRLLGGGFADLGVGSVDGVGSAALWWQTDGISVDATGRVFVSDSAGNTVRVGVPPAVAPAITAHPSGQSIASGANATFTVAASGTPAPTYQWQRLPSGSGTWANVSNGGAYSGATTTTLTVTAATVGMSGDQFRAVATNSASSATSNAALLTVAAPPSALKPFADFNGDGKADLVWHDSANSVFAAWLMNGTAIGGSNSYGLPAVWQIVKAADFDGDGKTDLVWRNTSTGALVLWKMNGTAIASSTWLYDSGTDWVPAVFADFNGDGKMDILWHNTVNDQYAFWLMNGGVVASASGFSIASGWNIAKAADFNGDSKADLLWRNASSGGVVMWLQDGTATTSATWIYDSGTDWAFQLFADFNGDGKTDILWRNTVTGLYAFWLMDGSTVASASGFSIAAGWSVTNAADFNGDSKADLIWRNSTSGGMVMWIQNGTITTSTAWIYDSGTDWEIKATKDFDGDGKMDILWHNTVNDQYAFWLMNGSFTTSASGFSLPAGWVSVE